MAKYNFPYETLAAAINDNFRLIGGPEKAYTMLKRGHYNVHYHADSVKSDKALLKALKEDPKKMAMVLDRASDKRLGRTGTDK